MMVSHDGYDREDIVRGKKLDGILKETTNWEVLI